MVPRFKKIVSDLSNHFDWIKQYGQYYEEAAISLVNNELYALLKFLESSIASAVPILMNRPKLAKKFLDFVQTSLADLMHMTLLFDLKPDEAASVLSALGKILTHYVSLMLNSKTIDKKDSKHIADDIHDLLRLILRESPQHVLDVILVLTHEAPENGSVSFYLMNNALENWGAYATNTDCVTFMKFLGICKVFYDGVKKNKTFVKKILGRIGTSPRGFSKALDSQMGIRVQVKGKAYPDDLNLLEYLWILNIMKVVKLSKKSLTVDSLPITCPIDDDSDYGGDAQEAPPAFFIATAPFLPNNEPDGDPQESNCIVTRHRINSELTNGHITLENLTKDTELDNTKASEPKRATTFNNREPPSEMSKSVFQDNISSDSNDDVQATQVKFQDEIPSDSVDDTDSNSELEGSGSDSDYTGDSDVQVVIFANSFSVLPDDLSIPVTEILPNVSAGTESSNVVGSYHLAAEIFDDEDEGSSDLNQPKLAGIIDNLEETTGQSSSYGGTNSIELQQPLHASISRLGPETPDGDSDSDIEIVAHLNADEEEVEQAAGQFNDRDEAPSDSDEAPYCKSRSPSPPSEPEDSRFTRRSRVQPHVSGSDAIPSTIYRIKDEPKSPQHESEDTLEYSSSSYVCDDNVIPFPENSLNIPAPDPNEATLSICNLGEENLAGPKAEAFHGIRTRSSKRTRRLCSCVGYQEEEEAPEEKKKSCPDPALMLPIEGRNLRSRNPSESSTPASPFTANTPQRKSTSRRNGYSREAERHVESRSPTRL